MKPAVFITCTQCHKDYHEDEICSYCGLCDNCCHCYSDEDANPIMNCSFDAEPVLVPSDGKTCIQCGEVFPDGIPYTCPLCNGCPLCCPRENLDGELV